MSVAVIINPVSGGSGRDRGRERVAQASATLRALGQPADILVAERRGHARALAARAVASGATLVLAWGGDGTMNEVASAVVGSTTALAIIPSGSGNGLARTLGVARDPIVAMRDACRAVPSRMDAGRCNGEWFFCVAGVGFDAHIAERFDRGGRTRRGLWAYVRLAVLELSRYRARSYRLDGIPLPRPALLVTVANAGQFGNGAWIAPAARLDDGCLDLVVVDARSPVAALGAARRLFTGTIGQTRGVSMRKVERVVIEDDTPIPYHLDGEPRPGVARLELTIAPAALLVSVR